MLMRLIFVIGDRKDSKYVKTECDSHSLKTTNWVQTVPDRGVVSSCDQLKFYEGSNHITGMAEPSRQIF